MKGHLPLSVSGFLDTGLPRSSAASRVTVATKNKYCFSSTVKLLIQRPRTAGGVTGALFSAASQGQLWSFLTWTSSCSGARESICLG